MNRHSIIIFSFFIRKFLETKTFQKSLKIFSRRHWERHRLTSLLVELEIIIKCILSYSMFSSQEVGIIEISNTLDNDFPSQINSSSVKKSQYCSIEIYSSFYHLSIYHRQRINIIDQNSKRNGCSIQILLHFYANVKLIEQKYIMYCLQYTLLCSKQCIQWC
jgi:hypothetical protein